MNSVIKQPKLPSHKLEIGQYVTQVETLLTSCDLLDKVGIKYLIGNRTEHVIFVILSDKNILSWNLRGVFFEFPVSDSELNNDIFEFYKKPLPEGLYLSLVTVKSEDESNYENNEQSVILYESKLGNLIQILHLCGSTLSNVGEKSQAALAYQKAIEINPKDSFSYNGLGNVLRSTRRFEEAVNVYKTASKVNPKDSYPCNGLGNALYSLGDLTGAIEAYKRATEINPMDSYSFHGIGNALRSLGRLEEAVEAYKKAIEINPKDAYPCNGLGNALRSLGRFEEAVEAYKKAIEINPKDAYAYSGLSKSLSELEKNEEALMAYKKYINLSGKQTY